MSAPEPQPQQPLQQEPQQLQQPQQQQTYVPNNTNYPQTGSPPMNNRPRNNQQMYSDDMPEMYISDSVNYVDHDVKTYISWNAPGRPFKEHSKEYFFNGFLIMVAIEIILFLFSQYLLMLVVFSFVFLSFALAIVPPKMFFYKITSEGLRIEDHFFIWDELYDFYFFKHHGEETMHVRTKAFFPGELTITLGDVPPGQIKAIMLQFLPFREYVKPTFSDQAGDWLQQNFPLERSSV